MRREKVWKSNREKIIMSRRGDGMVVVRGRSSEVSGEGMGVKGPERDAEGGGVFGIAM